MAEKPVLGFKPNIDLRLSHGGEVLMHLLSVHLGPDFTIGTGHARHGPRKAFE